MIWALGYFPRLESLESERGEALVAQHLEEVGTGGTEAFLELPEEQQLQIIAQEQSYIGRISASVRRRSSSVWQLARISSRFSVLMIKASL